MAQLFRFFSWVMILLWIGGLAWFGFALEVQAFLLIGAYGLIMDWHYRRIESRKKPPIGTQLLLASSSNYGASVHHEMEPDVHRTLSHVD